MEEAVQEAAGGNRLRDAGQAAFGGARALHGPRVLRGAVRARLPADLRQPPARADRDGQAQLPGAADGARRPVLPLQEHRTVGNDHAERHQGDNGRAAGGPAVQAARPARSGPEADAVSAPGLCALSHPGALSGVPELYGCADRADTASESEPTQPPLRPKGRPAAAEPDRDRAGLHRKRLYRQGAPALQRQRRVHCGRADLRAEHRDDQPGERFVFVRSRVQGVDLLLLEPANVYVHLRDTGSATAGQHRL
uniref:(northern house mosquito) hypothetical protein n=1 Tax=Culex pipiens TaxID=7175 RepID=A0A8D8HIC8_CULPI